MRGLLSRLGARINSSPRWDCKAAYVAIDAVCSDPRRMGKSRTWCRRITVGANSFASVSLNSDR